MWLLLLALLQPVPDGAVTIARGASSLIHEPKQAVVRTTDEWRSLWAAHDARNPPPSVDFSKNMVVALFLGSRRTAGFSVDITGVESGPSALTVTYAEQGPAPGDITAQMLTFPFVMVALPRQTGDVVFLAVNSDAQVAPGAPPASRTH
jgi:hypothetical protein